jgi:uncharacterized protein (DUF2141 family)
VKKPFKMKKLLLVTGLIWAIGLSTHAQEKTGSAVTVIVENELSDGGSILAGLHNPETFMKGEGIINVSAPAKKGEVTLTFENVAPGTYAVMVMHDANDNRRMDMDASGMPQESYANTGELNLYGPPTFDGAKFEVNGEDQEFRIRF